MFTFSHTNLYIGKYTTIIMFVFLVVDTQEDNDEDIRVEDDLTLKLLSFENIGKETSKLTLDNYNNDYDLEMSY